MKAFDWVLLTVSVLWCLWHGLKVIVLLNSYEVRYRNAKITVPLIIPLFPIVAWLIIAYRVGG